MFKLLNFVFIVFIVVNPITLFMSYTEVLISYPFTCICQIMKLLSNEKYK